MMTMIALIPHTFHGRQLDKGDVFTCSAVEAASLRYLNKAEFAPAKVQTTVATAEAPKRRRYRRRDLTADPE